MIVARLGISCIDEKPREVFFLTFDNILCKGIFSMPKFEPLQLLLDVNDV